MGAAIGSAQAACDATGLGGLFVLHGPSIISSSLHVYILYSGPLWVESPVHKFVSLGTNTSPIYSLILFHCLVIPAAGQHYV